MSNEAWIPLFSGKGKHLGFFPEREVSGRLLRGALPATYIVFQEGGRVKAVSGATGRVEVEGEDAAEVIQAVIDATPSGRIFLRDGTYDLGAKGLTVKRCIALEGESPYSTILLYSGPGAAVRGTDLDHFRLRSLRISVGSSAEGCLLVGEHTTFARIEDAVFTGDKTATGQYGIRFDGGSSWCYYNTVDGCLFRNLNLGIVTRTSGTEPANGQLIVNPVFYDIGAVGIDFYPDGSGEHTVLGGWWASSPGATGFRSNGYASQFIGCQLEMGANAKSFELGPDSSRNVIIINDNNPLASVAAGSNHHIIRSGDLTAMGSAVFDRITPKSTLTLTFGTERELRSEAMLHAILDVEKTHPNALAFASDCIYCTAPTADAHEVRIILGKRAAGNPLLRVGWLGTVEAYVYYDWDNWSASCHLETSPDGSTWTTRASTPQSGSGYRTLTWTPAEALTENLYVRVRLRQASHVANTHPVARLHRLTVSSLPLNAPSVILPPLKVSSSGTATIPSGSSSVTVQHGLPATPRVVVVTGRHSETASAFVSARDASTITISVPAPVTADRAVDWYAEL